MGFLDAVYQFLGKVVIWLALGYGAYYLFKQVNEEVKSDGTKGKKKLTARERKQAEAEAQKKWKESQTAKLSKTQKKRQKQKEKKKRLESENKAAKKKAKKEAHRQKKAAAGGSGPAPQNSKVPESRSPPTNRTRPSQIEQFCQGLEQGTKLDWMHESTSEDGPGESTEPLPEWAFPVKKGTAPEEPLTPVSNSYAGRFGTAGSGRPNAAPRPTGGIVFKMATYKQKQKIQAQAPASPKQSGKQAAVPKTRNKLDFPTLAAPKPAVAGPQAPFVPVTRKKAAKKAVAPAKIPTSSNPFDSPPKPVISGFVSPDVVTVVMPDPKKKKTGKALYEAQLREFGMALQKARLDMPELPGKKRGDPERKWKQGDVAIKLGLTPNDYARFEQGKKYPPPPMINKMNRVFGVIGVKLPRVKKPPAKERQPIAEDYM